MHSCFSLSLMCGICCCCCCCFGDVTPEALAAGPLGRRGPDRTQLQALDLPSCSSPRGLLLGASVLHHRGLFAPQPLRSASGDLVLLWNGEIFAGLAVPPGENDGVCLLAALEAATPSEEALFGVLGRLRGPFAFVLLHRPSARLFFGRDSLGRRSLLVGRSPGGHLHLSSVLLPNSPPDTEELPPVGLLRWRLGDGQLLLRPWDFAPEARAREFSASLDRFEEKNCPTTLYRNFSSKLG